MANPDRTGILTGLTRPAANQRGTHFHPADGLGRCGEDTLLALRAGKVEFGTRRGRRVVNIAIEVAESATRTWERRTSGRLSAFPAAVYALRRVSPVENPSPRIWPWWLADAVSAPEWASRCAGRS